VPGQTHRDRSLGVYVEARFIRLVLDRALLQPFGHSLLEGRGVIGLRAVVWCLSVYDWAGPRAGTSPGAVEELGSSDSGGLRGWEPMVATVHDSPGDSWVPEIWT